MQPIKHFHNKTIPSTMLPIKSRSVTDEDRAILKDAFSELQGSFASHTFGYWYGFLKELVSD